MPKYAVDPDGVEHVASTLRLTSDFAPRGRLASAHGCGSSVVESAIDEANAEFDRAWRDAFEALDSRASGAIEAAMRYRENENRVAGAARKGR